MRKKILYLLLLFPLQLFLSQGLQLSTPASDRNLGMNTNVSAPNDTRLLRFSDFPNIDFIGKADISIPIYEIDLDGLKIPIGLSYDTKGNKISDNASDVGLGWTLIAGGSVNLQQNDIYDFSRDFTQSAYDSNSSGTYNWGFWSAQRTGWFASNYNISGMSTYEPTTSSKYFDSAPDFYLVQAPGLNDKFYLKGEGQIDLYGMESLINFKNKFSSSLVASNSLKCVDTNQINSQPMNFYVNSYEKVCKFDHFNILNEMGFEYTFENPREKHINNYKGNPLPRLNSSLPKFPYAWDLSKIQSPYSQNSKVTFEYENYINDSFTGILSISTELNRGSIDINQGIFLHQTERNSNPYESSSGYTSRLFNSKRIKKITFNEGSINFNYGGIRQDYDGNVLSEITINDLSGKLIKKTTFSYSYFQPKDSQCVDGKECLRLKLDKIYDSNLNSNYIFNYGTNSNDVLFPPKHSFETDYLGYYNNNGSSLKYKIVDKVMMNGQILINDFYSYETNVSANEEKYYGTKIYFYPNINKDYFLPFKLTNKMEESVSGYVDRTPNNKSLLGLLNKIIYPTGGSLNLTYENDKFLYEGSEYLLGSARVSKLELKDSDGTTLKQENYEYLGDNGLSSGQLNFIKPPSSLLRGDTDGGFFYNNSSIVGYSKVTKKINGKGMVASFFTNFSNYNDVFETISPPVNTVGTSNFIKYFKFPSSYMQSMDLNRGRILKQEEFAEDGTRVSKTDFLYYDYSLPLINTTKNLFEQMFYSNGALYWVNHTANNHLVKYSKSNVSILTQYFYPNSQTILNSKSITYDLEKNIIKSSGVISADQVVSETKYYYPYEFPNNTSLVNLYSRNIIKPVVTENYYNNNLVSKKEIIYTINTVLPSSILSYNMQNPSIANAEITYDQYDNFGNFLQYTTKSGVSTTIIWGYNNTQPIAKIEGAKLSDISQSLIDNIVSASNNDAQLSTDASEQSLISALDLFRNYSALSAYQISTYTYDPLIGVRSITPPSGIRESYIYDSANRLQKVIDVNGKVLKEMKYNYKN
ncbi:hypothetical protein ACM40_20110 [Chryseobacterium sp. BLS98]|uniref:RHS repeat protein n=1 Tax=Chryseobacterium sp. BLS98 TaxID=885586 RepID=UPI00065AA89B|nr:RHS repeat protein [Chryseobacterium sp. BLS98]KMQ58392.1 hypothetical protein ACM40_20110 [Chryseobacterium sp. BLS98]